MTVRSFTTLSVPRCLANCDAYYSFHSIYTPTHAANHTLHKSCMFYATLECILFKFRMVYNMQMTFHCFKNNKCCVTHALMLNACSWISKMADSMTKIHFVLKCESMPHKRVIFSESVKHSFQKIHSLTSDYHWLPTIVKLSQFKICWRHKFDAQNKLIMQCDKWTKICIWNKPKYLRNKAR